MEAPIRVLHVDDETRFLELSAEFLAAADDRLSVVTEPTAADGLDRLDTEAFDCVVSDYRMPSMTGIEFLEAVRERFPSLPFVLFTGEGSEPIASDAISAGATDYLRKRTGTEQYELLANRVLNAVESYRTRRELERYELLVETVGDPMYMLDGEGTVTLANEALADMLGHDRRDIVGMDAEDLLVAGDYRAGSDCLTAVRGDPDADWSAFEAGVQTADGEVVPTEISTAPIADDAGDSAGSVGVVRERPAADRVAPGSFISPSRAATGEMPESSTPTPTTDPDRRTTDDHGHDIVTPLQAAIITVSTSRAAAADPDDPGGDRIESLLEAAGHRVVDRRLVADGRGPIQAALDDLVAEPTVDFVVATGGTGPTVDDVTPEAVSERFDRELPGFGELFRRLSFEEIGTRVVATRATAGIASATPVFVVPGSTNAVELATEAIIIEEAPHLVGLSTRHLAADSDT